MPTYEYVCKACGDKFDIVQSFSDKPLKKHPGDCGGPVQKVFHASGIVFKGSGFYVTDSRGASSVKTASEPSTSPSKSPKSDTSSKSDSSD
ncbi:MAG: FmdB family transcriptional regulator [Acidimicrobiia bacterium]|nr:FmdB family transcriptional regulator [Acidimicrobiia bacterium]